MSLGTYDGVKVAGAPKPRRRRSATASAPEQLCENDPTETAAARPRQLHNDTAMAQQEWLQSGPVVEGQKRKWGWGGGGDGGGRNDVEGWREGEDGMY